MTVYNNQGAETMAWVPKALLLTSDDEEAHHLREELEGDGFVVFPAKPQEVGVRLEEETYDAVFCAWSFYHANCEGALKEVRERYPGLPVMVLSHTKTGS
jgi:DNA-binding response OmpR family regulator